MELFTVAFEYRLIYCKLHSIMYQINKYNTKKFVKRISDSINVKSTTKDINQTEYQATSIGTILTPNTDRTQ